MLNIYFPGSFGSRYSNFEYVGEYLFDGLPACIYVV